MRGFIEENFLYLRPDVELADGDDFLALGIIDSLGFVELVEEVQSRYADRDRRRRDHRGELRLDRRDHRLRRAQACRGVSIRTIVDDLSFAAERDPDRVAVIAGDREVGYGELDRLAGGFAAGLAELGVRRGDRVAVLLPNEIDAAVAIEGTLARGSGARSAQPDDSRATASTTCWPTPSRRRSSATPSAPTWPGPPQRAPAGSRWSPTSPSSRRATEPRLRGRSRPTSPPSCTRRARPAVPRESRSPTATSPSSPGRSSTTWR